MTDFMHILNAVEQDYKKAADSRIHPEVAPKIVV